MSTTPAIPGLDFSSGQPAPSASFANPLQSTPLGTFANNVAQNLPQGMWPGNPLRTLAGYIPQAYAAGGNATQPTTGVLGTQTSSNGGGSITPAQKQQAWQASGGQGDVPVGWNPTTNNSQQQQQSMQDQIRGEIGSGFDSYINGLNQQLGLLPEHYDALKGNIDSLFGGQQSTINTARTNQNAELDNSSQQAQLQQASTLRDLSTNFQNDLNGAVNKLGSMGAADSSASPMFAYALSLQANKNRGNVMQQAAGIQNDINLKRTQVNSTLDDQMNQLNTWKNTQLSNLAQWLTDQKSQFANAIGMAQNQKAQALASLDQTALGRLQQLDDQFTQWKQGLQQWAVGQQTQLGNTLAYLGQLSAVNIPQFTAGSINTAINTAANADPTQLFGYNPFAGNGQKTDQFGNPIQ